MQAIVPWTYISEDPLGDELLALDTFECLDGVIFKDLFVVVKLLLCKADEEMFTLTYQMDHICFSFDFFPLFFLFFILVTLTVLIE